MATTVLIFDKKTDNNCASAWRFLTRLCRPFCNYDLAFAYTKFSDYVNVNQTIWAASRCSYSIERKWPHVRLKVWYGRGALVSCFSWRSRVSVLSSLNLRQKRNSSRVHKQFCLFFTSLFAVIYNCSPHSSMYITFSTGEETSFNNQKMS